MSKHNHLQQFKLCVFCNNYAITCLSKPSIVSANHRENIIPRYEKDNLFKAFMLNRNICGILHKADVPFSFEVKLCTGKHPFY